VPHAPRHQLPAPLRPTSRPRASLLALIVAWAAAGAACAGSRATTRPTANPTAQPRAYAAPLTPGSAAGADLLRRAGPLLARGDAAGALAVLDPGARDEAPTSRPYLALALALDGVGRPEEAVRLLRAIPFAERSAEAGVALVNAALAAGDREAARDEGERLTAARPARADAWYALGRAYLTLGRIDDAEAAFGEVLHLQPDHLGAQKGLLVVASYAPESAEFQALARELSRRAPDDPDVLNDLGAAQLSLGHMDEAEALFRRALEAAPEHPWANLNLADLLADRGEPARARPFYERFLRTAPRYAAPAVARVKAAVAASP